MTQIVIEVEGHPTAVHIDAPMVQRKDVIVLTLTPKELTKLIDELYDIELAVIE